jgi:site-specific DNA recombinase
MCLVEQKLSGCTSEFVFWLSNRGEWYRSQHQAAFTHEEWQKIRIGSRMNYNAPHRAEQARRVYEFAGYVADIHCGLTLRCQGSEHFKYYKDVAKKRQLPCPVGGFLQVRVDDIRLQFGELLEGFSLPGHWREEVRRKMLESMEQAGLDT